MAWKRESSRPDRLQSLQPYGSHSFGANHSVSTVIDGNEADLADEMGYQQQSSSTQDPTNLERPFVPDKVAKDSRVYVGNLPWHISNDDLKKIMESAGVVVSCDILKNFDGRSKGCALVDFSNGEEAQRALQELNQKEW